MGSRERGWRGELEERVGVERERVEWLLSGVVERWGTRERRSDDGEGRDDVSGERGWRREGEAGCLERLEREVCVCVCVLCGVCVCCVCVYGVCVSVSMCASC